MQDRPKNASCVETQRRLRVRRDGWFPFHGHWYALVTSPRLVSGRTVEIRYSPSQPDALDLYVGRIHVGFALLQPALFPDLEQGDGL